MSTPARRVGRSVLAVLTGFVVVFVLSLGTDQVFHVLAVYPPWDQPMFDPRLNALALAYRLVYDAISRRLGPAWYPIGLAASALPTAWLGGVLYLRQQARATSHLAAR